MTVIGPLEMDEVKAVRFDFSKEVSTGATLQGTPTVTVSVVSGVDNNPSAVLFSPAVVSGREVVQVVHPGVVGCKYKLRATVGDSTGLTHGMSAYLQVVNG